MALRLSPSDPIVAGVQRIAMQQLDDALQRIERLDPGDHGAVANTVHEVRKRCKEVRGILGLLAPVLSKKQRRAGEDLRRAARQLSVIRDAQVQARTAERLACQERDQSGEAALVLDRLTGEHRAAAASAAHGFRRESAGLDEATRLLRSARKRIGRWKLREDPEAILKGLAATYRRGRRRHRRAVEQADDVAAHRWRASVKQLWYQVRLLESSAPSVLSPLAAELDGLGEALGDDHDLALLIRDLTGMVHLEGQERLGATQAAKLARRRQQQLRDSALRLGFSLYAESPEAFRKRVSAYLVATRRHGPETAEPEPKASSNGRGPDDEQSASYDDRRSGLAEDSTTSGPGRRSTVEYERKFMFDNNLSLDFGHDFDLDSADGERIMQGYLVVDGGVSVRLRENGSAQRWLTIKGGRAPARTEVELELDVDSFDALWPFVGSRRIDKIRYRRPVGRHVAEIDVYEGTLAGLGTVEVEFDDLQAMEAFDPPDWFGPEVTDDDRYSNAALACHGLTPLQGHDTAPTQT